jgi:UDP-glucose 4-epimerase
MAKIFVTGAAGFIGSHLVDRLLERGDEVVGWDNFSTGQRPFLAEAMGQKGFRLVEGDTLDLPGLTKAMAGCEMVYHLAANADVRFGLEHPSRDLEQNTIATFNVLEAMRKTGASTIAFSSTGSVYGESDQIPIPERAAFPVQTSLYGASKLAGESLIQAYCEGYRFEGYIFRFVSNLGERYSHGHVFDFFQQLQQHPDHLRVLGNGKQKKSYIHVSDCVSAMLHVVGGKTALAQKHRVDVFNVGRPDYCEVNDSIRWITEHLRVTPRLEYTGGDRGWVGDNPFIFLDTEKLQRTGWQAKVGLGESIGRTLDWLAANRWIFEKR